MLCLHLPRCAYSMAQNDSETKTQLPNFIFALHFRQKFAEKVLTPVQALNIASFPARIGYILGSQRECE